MCLSDKGSSFAHSKSDLQKPRCLPVKKIVEIQQGTSEWNSILGHQGVMCAALGVGDMSLPKNEAANRTMLCH
jgi:hypothetical protein